MGKQTSSCFIYSSCFLLPATLASCSSQEETNSYNKLLHVHPAPFIKEKEKKKKKRKRKKKEREKKMNYLTNCLGTLNSVQTSLQIII
jgi:hypothetical protein